MRKTWKALILSGLFIIGTLVLATAPEMEGEEIVICCDR